MTCAATGFTGKERDQETGLDYFGARYYSGAQGRFTTPDPLMASGKASNPQTWNRYAYTLNNPLRFVDPDGLEVPDECVKDQNCAIKLKVNVIYDKDMNKQTGPNPAQVAKAKKMQEEANQVLAKANVRVETDVTPGEYTGGAPDINLTGLKSDDLNVVFSSTTPFGHSGESNLYQGKIPTTIININDASTGRWIPGFWSPTLIHEYGEQFVHVGTPSGFFSNLGGDMRIDLMLNGVRKGDASAVQDLRQQLGNKRYAVPLTPEANKPRQ